MIKRLFNSQIYYLTREANYASIDDKIFEVWYYYTDMKAYDGAITDDELTPVVFENDKLIGWGQSFLNDTVQRYEIRLR
ncbi:MAG: DUF3192 domain-containing protein [Ignavibacteriaceae bacterium]|nr:DUF3192 domain-containing protein [Ignavibacteriaceae bacterium]